MASIVHPETLTLNDFAHLYEQGAFEIINGERIPRVPPLALHVLIARRLMDIFREYEQASKAGIAFSEAPFVLVDESDWVRGSRSPDVMFYEHERFANYQKQMTGWEEKPFVLVPDVAVEVLSKNDTYSEVDEKVEQYLRDGVKLVWVVDPRRKRVIIHRLGEEPARLTEQDTLTGGDILPNFEFPVSRIFA